MRNPLHVATDRGQGVPLGVRYWGGDGTSPPRAAEKYVQSAWDGFAPSLQYAWFRDGVADVEQTVCFIRFGASPETRSENITFYKVILTFFCILTRKALSKPLVL